ncbi:WD40-repeat-containing domain protein [Lobosporangium transversale]|uniref:WD40-repeat-containing domain protein n=1 Tax=Lobosporangium transversale TaxID=64571 RepID=A0A1Y2GXP2_9FUNG|nr:WD40-repeat-containing domain protein [Lobosporangium transversale]ORZ26584.1 WD40-repeat-containing domain protein [Lobosporangium transversale]|eukprot:XP_021884347.1 WD40-repeat-containing domain protein [Lobosporangium transversale]
MAKLQSRWAHASEVTALAFVPDGSYIVATADDFALHLFSQKEGKPARQAEPIESTEGATCIAVTQENIYAGSRDGVIRQYDIKLQEFMGIIVRCNLAVRCLALSKNQKLLGIGTEENEIKIINLEDPEECFPLQGHKKAINAIAFDPLAEYMLSSSCDGTVIVWDMKTKKSAPLEIITVMAPTSTESKYKIPIAWHTSGEFFVIGRDKDITAHHRHTWQKSFTYRSGSSAAPTILAWSPNGRYLAAASIETDIWIWKYKEKEQPHIKHTHKTGVTDLTWSPSRNCLAFADAAGEVTYWEEVIEDGTPLKEPTPDPLKGLFDEPTARGNEIGAQETEGAQKDHDMGDLAQEYLSDNESLRDFIVDDENDPYLQKKASTGAQKSGALGMRVAKALHPRFQPGSTAERDKRRYLAFNLLGLITTVDHGNHATVSVEFHDKLTHRGYHFTDGSHYTMACLGMTGALFAAPERAETPSTVFFRTYDSWATKSEWQIFLPEGEDVTAIALNAESAIVSTSRGFVRIFSQSGIQTGLFSLGSVIAAVGKDDMVFFIYHQGEPFEGSQNLGYSIYNVETAQRIQHGLLPVLDDTIITWLGFSEGGIPAFYDDKGVMYILNYYRRVDQGQWTPILDTTAVQNTESDTNNVPHYWLVGLTDQTATFVKCRRGETEPSFPKPFVTELPLKVLTLHQDTPAGQHEEAWLRNKILSGLNKDEKIARSIESIDNSAAKRELEMDKLALQMIDLACRADRTQKALDLTAMLCSLKSIDNAMKIAQHHSLHTLMERMSRVKEIKVRRTRTALRSRLEKRKRIK